MDIQYIIGTPFMVGDPADVKQFCVRYHLLDGSDRIEAFVTLADAQVRWDEIQAVLDAKRA